MKKLIGFIGIFLVASQSRAMDFEKYKADEIKKREYAAEEAKARIERVHSGGTKVAPWTQAEIKLRPHEHGHKTMYVDGLHGAIVLALFAKHQSGMRSVMLSNYPDVSIELQEKKVGSFIKKLHKHSDSVQHVDLMMVHSDTIEYSRYINHLKRSMKKDPIIHRYPLDIIEGQQRTFQVHVTHSKVIWRLFSDGYVAHEITE